MSYIFFTLIGIIPSFAWLIFFLKEDVHPEPKKMIAKVFAYGALITIVAVSIQYLSRTAFLFLKIDNFSFFPIFLFAATEEILKFLVVYAIIHKNKYFDEPIDAMIYMVVAALGFALVENIAVVAVAKNIPDAVGTLTLRFVGATLLHALSSGIIGYYWAKSIIHKKTLKFLITIILGILIASVIHAAFNYLIVAIKDVIIYPTLFLIVVALIVFWDFEKIKKEEAAQ